MQTLSTIVKNDEREKLRPYFDLIRNPDQLYARTTAGELFDCLDHATMAFLIWRRMGRNFEATGAAWRRLMQSDCPTSEVIALVAFHVVLLTGTRPVTGVHAIAGPRQDGCDARSELQAAEAERVHDHRHRAEAHCRAGDDRAQSVGIFRFVLEFIRVNPAVALGRWD